MLKYTTILTIPNFDDATIESAKKLFMGYRKNKVILGSTFQDAEWHMCDEYSNVTINFHICDCSGYEDILGMTEERLIEYMKTYVVYRLGELSLPSIQDIIRLIRRIFDYPLNEIMRLADDLNSGNISRVSEFFSMLPDERDKVSDILDALASVEDELTLRPSGGQRQLASFDSYFKFADILDRFWRESGDDDENLFYFPVYLWWHVTGIIPTRPREFILTPRNCLKRDGQHNYLTLRKDKLKGPQKRVSYKISQDYQLVTYEITDELADAIQWYLDKTEDAIPSEIGTLLRTNSHYMMWDRNKPWNSRYFTYSNLATCLRYFFHKIIIGRYGYKVLFERDKQFLEDDEIQYLSLGDTRHLSLINIIALGATPMVAQLLAGHDNPNMASHYYSNIQNLIECRTYRQFKKLAGKGNPYEVSFPQEKISAKEFVEIEGGRCYSEKVLKGDYTDCYKTAGPTGEVGLCSNCIHFRTDTSRESFKNGIYSECVELDKIIKQIRQGNGESEEMIQALLRLRAKEYSYQEFLRETMEAEYGEK